MSDTQARLPSWTKSSASGTGNCVEVQRAGASILVRDSKHPHGPQLTFTIAEWAAFLQGAQAGEFNLDRLPG